MQGPTVHKMIMYSLKIGPMFSNTVELYNLLFWVVIWYVPRSSDSILHISMGMSIFKGTFHTTNYMCENSVILRSTVKRLRKSS